MERYKGKNIISIVSSVVCAIIGIMVLTLSRGSIWNIIGIAFMLLAVIGFANYHKYSIILDSKEIRITGLFKGKSIEYKNIIKIFTVHAGKTSITYIVDKYMEKGKWYIRGTYPPVPVEKYKDAEYNSLSDLISINSYVFDNYKELLSQIVKKVKNTSDIDSATWSVINSK